jgi:hypothetical protein
MKGVFEMKVMTIANMMQVSEKARQEVPELASKVQEEYNELLEKALTTKENNKYLTDCQQAKVDEGKKQVQDFTKNIVNKVNKEYNASRIERLNEIFKETREIANITIDTDWRRGSYGANQCKASVRVIYKDYSVEEYESSHTGGCGYDKQSTATGEALTQINALMQEFCKAANEAVKAGKSYRDYIGYGSGYSVVPYFEGGVGFSCHQHILEKLGYKFKHVHWTDKTDVYEFAKE